METSYYLMTFDTDLGKTLTVRISKAAMDLPQAIAAGAMDKIFTANCFAPENGRLVAKKSLKCVSTVVTALDIGA
jgi:hypothetical protein